ncbi:transcription factor MYB1R1 [Canna indica]|uniref:Transcription factor MYB1R1 n=1 Tax=Canna indica TaxID=4628 RepID=A0AAQ3K0S9_9LILI|nr:transcription factor MYB1R1 [Canna indica]
MVRKCSHCGHNGHNSRTCISTRSMVGEGGGVRLFGVQLHMASSLKKSFSMDCLSYNFPAAAASSSPSSSTSSLGSIDETTEKIPNGYLSDGLGGRTQERKKGVPWTEEEHKLFLAGLEKLGKGDWRGISRNFVTSRTPTQVASHAQKYFLRQNSLNKRKRRSSLFDVVANCGGAAQNTPSLVTTTARASETATIDLNSSSQEHEIQLPSCLNHMPGSSVSSLSRSSSSSMESTQISHLDLELRISSSRLSQNQSSPGNLCLGTIKVT